MARNIEIRCSDDLKNIFVEALTLYAHAAFPDSASPCQMVSRDALTSAAEVFDKHHRDTGTGIISSRMQALMKAAIRYYFKLQSEQTRMPTQHQCELLLDLCKGGSRSQQDLQKAIEADNS
jgi:hypothetical protein